MRRRTPRRPSVFLLVEIDQVPQQVLPPAWIHQRVKPRQDQEPAAPAKLRAALDDQEPERRLPSGVYRQVQLGLQLLVERGGRGHDDLTHRRGFECGARTDRPVKPAPRKPAPQSGRGPRAELHEPAKGPEYARRLDRPVALDDQERVVADLHPGIVAVHRHEHEIRAAQGEPTRAPGAPGIQGGLASRRMTARAVCRVDGYSSRGHGRRRCSLLRDPRRASRTRIPSR